MSISDVRLSLRVCTYLVSRSLFVVSCSGLKLVGESSQLTTNH